MRKVLFLACFAICYALSFTSCSEDETGGFIPRPSPDLPAPSTIHAKTNRTVLAYIVGGTNLWRSLEANINQMEEGWDDSIDGTLLVYLDNSPNLTQFGESVLLQITHDETDLIVSEVVKTYPEQDSGAPDVMRSVLNDAISLYPAESHGLIISSHGDGWLPGFTGNETKGISGPDRYGSFLEIDDLAKILPMKYEFIMFDACCMSNIETAYQLRNKCEYLMGSALPLPGAGLPYNKIIRCLYTKPKPDLYKASLLSVKEYAETKDISTYKEITLEVIKTSELENLAAATSKYLDALNMNYSQIWNELGKDRDLEIQGQTQTGNVVIDYYAEMLLDLQGLYYLSEDPSREAFKAALDKAVIQNYAYGITPTIEKIGKGLGSGLSFYLPFTADDPYMNYLNKKFHEDYEWAKASGFAKER